MNTEIDNLTSTEALAAMDSLVRQRCDSFVVTPNVDHIVRLEKDPRLRAAYRDADLILADGRPLLWIARACRTPIREKISGSDLLPKICAMAAARGYSVFLLGAAEGVASKAAENLVKAHPGLKIAGTHSPPLGFENDPVETAKTIETVTRAHPDILIVALGCPKQEIFIHTHRHSLHVPLSLGLGAAVDFAALTLRRAPEWMSDNGLEWLYRITQDPRRLLRRYIIDDFPILRLAARHIIRARRER